MNLLIKSGMKVTLHFELLLDDDARIDGTKSDQPASFTVGDGNLPENFERYLLGLSAGCKRRFILTPQQGFGDYRPENILKYPQSAFESKPTENGEVVLFKNARGEQCPGVIKTIESDYVEVDFNHPLSGRTLIFAVEIIDVSAVAA